MINTLRARNFKSWADTTELCFAPLTGLFGTNSSGKTSILQMLLALKQTAESPDRRRVLHMGDERSHVDLGTFHDLVHNHQLDASIEMRLDWTLPSPLEVQDPKKEASLFHIEQIRFDSSIQEVSDRFVVESFAYSFGRYEFGMRRAATSYRSDRDEYELVHTNYKAKRVHGRAWPLPAPVKCYGFPDEATGYYQNTGFLSLFVLALEDLLSHVVYLGPLREYPHRGYIWAGESPADVGQKGELAVPALLASRGRKPTISRGQGKKTLTVEERVATWLREMDLIHSFSLKRIAKNRNNYEVRVRKTRSSAEVLITDVGFGVSQVLPILVLCYYVPEHSIVLLEQPEIHLHPSVQAALADVIIDAVTTRNIQVIVESHSEHLLRRLQRRIAEEKITSDETALYFCRMENGASQIEKLDVDMWGNIRNWPQDFFGDEMGDLAAMTEAAMKRAEAVG